MILYLIIGFIATAISATLGFTIGINFLGASVLEVILNIVLTLLTLLIIDIVFALLARAFPKKWVNPFNKIYKVSQFERKLYLKLGVKKWKDVIPESGKKLVGFDKRQVADMNNNDYIFKFMEESVYAEIMHILSFIGSFIYCFVFVRLGLTVRLPLIIANMIFQLLPVIVQRHNRPKLMLVYERNKRLQKQKED